MFNRNKLQASKYLESLLKIIRLLFETTLERREHGKGQRQEER
jgi:hypothetical protein